MMPAATKVIAVISTVHDTYDTRILYKQIDSLRRQYSVLYLSPVLGVPDEDWIVPLHKSQSKLGRLKTHVSLMRRLFGLRADLYLLHDPELLPLGIVLALLGKRVVWDMHEDTYNDIKTKAYLSPAVRMVSAATYRLVQTLAYRALRGFVLAEDAYGKYFPGSKKTCVVHNYPLLDRLNKFGEVEKRPNTLVYIGSISANRGIYQLLEVVSKLTARLPDIRLMLIGPFVDSVLEREVRSLIRQKGIETNVEICGPIKNVEAYPVVAQCMIGVALLLPEPNFAESLPTKMFEYMALGLPVVVSAFPLWERIVSRHTVGMAMDPLNTGAVADAIHSLLTDKPRYNELSRNARSAASQYSWETESLTFRTFLSGILAK